MSEVVLSPKVQIFNSFRKFHFMEEYKTTLGEIEVANPRKDGTTYDMGVCFDMLIADYNRVKEGKKIDYPFADSDKFDWEQFGADLKEI